MGESVFEMTFFSLLPLTFSFPVQKKQIEIRIFETNEALGQWEKLSEKDPLLIAIDAQSKTKRWIIIGDRFRSTGFLIGVSLWCRRNVIISMPNSNKLHQINLPVI